jgi:hypothetical protein
MVLQYATSSQYTIRTQSLVSSLTLINYQIV